MQNEVESKIVIGPDFNFFVESTAEKELKVWKEKGNN